MFFGKKIIITKHAMERYEERLRDHTYKNEVRKFKKNKVGYMLKLFKPMNVKRFYRKNDNIIVIIKGNYRCIFEEKGQVLYLLTIMPINQKKLKKGY